MDTFLPTILKWLLALLEAYPPAAAALGVAASIAAAVLVFQVPMGRYVRGTPSTVDDKVLKYLLMVFNVLTPKGSRPGEDVDVKVVANLVKKYGDASKVPTFVLTTLTEKQKRDLADAYVASALE